MSIVTFPFMAREVIALLEEESWAVVYGLILTTARTPGEFGAVAGVRGHTDRRGQAIAIRYQRSWERIAGSISGSMTRYRLTRDDGQSDALTGSVFDSYDQAYAVLERYYSDLCCSDDRIYYSIEESIEEQQTIPPSRS